MIKLLDTLNKNPNNIIEKINKELSNRDLIIGNNCKVISIDFDIYEKQWLLTYSFNGGDLEYEQLYHFTDDSIKKLHNEILIIGNVVKFYKKNKWKLNKFVYEKFKKYNEYIVESNNNNNNNNLKKFIDNLYEKNPDVLQKLKNILISKEIKFYVTDFKVPWDIFSSEESFIKFVDIFRMGEYQNWLLTFDADWLYNKENFSLSDLSEKGSQKLYNEILKIGKVDKLYKKINKD